jgi:hypothetical protein
MRETVRILGGEAFIDYFSDPSESNNGQVIFMANKEIMSEPMWGEGSKIKAEDAVKYAKTASTERGSAIIIAQIVDLINTEEHGAGTMKDIIHVSDDRLIPRPDHLIMK